MKRLTATFCLTIAVLLGSAGMSFALPECDGSPLVVMSTSDMSEWDNCEGTYIVDPSVSKYGDDKYVGEFRNGKSNGQGTYTFANGSKYVGEFRNDKRNGQGTLTFASGSKYVGEFRNNKFHGQFTVTYADGNKYVGEFRNDKKNGQGTMTFADGRTKEGVWKAGKFQYA